MALRILMITLLFLGVGCNSYKSKLISEDGSVMPASIDFNFVQARVFEPYCLKCHSVAGGNDGDVNLESYNNVLLNLEAIRQTTLIELSMPPKKAGGPLPEFPREVLRLWLEAGAPNRQEEAEKPTLPPPPAPPMDVQPTWSDISEKIFIPKCIKCHSAGGKAEDSPLYDRSYVVDPENLLVTPGEPEYSEIMRSITREDKKRMPPAKTGLSLSAQEIEAIRVWILNGAVD